MAMHLRQICWQEGLGTYAVGLFLTCCMFGVILISCQSEVADARNTLFAILSTFAVFVCLQNADTGKASSVATGTGQTSEDCRRGELHTESSFVAAGRAAEPRCDRPQAERVNVTHRCLRLKAAQQLEADARVLEQAQLEGVEQSVHAYSRVMFSCTQSNALDMALRLFNHMLERGVDYDYDAIPMNTRSMFFTLVVGHVDDKYLRKNGFKMLEVVLAHGITMPHILQDRVICAWGSKLPENLLEYFARMREDGISLSSTAQCCIAHTDRVPPPTTLRCGAQRELESTHVPHRARVSAPPLPRPPPPEEPAKTPETLAEATPSRLRSQASTFVPMPPGRPSARLDWYGEPAPDESSAQVGWCDSPPDEPSTPVCWYGASVGELSYPGQMQTVMQMQTQMREPITTVLVGNLPGRVLRDDVLDKIDQIGFAGCYDFVYFPVDFYSGNNLGYGFLNLISEEEMWRFMHAFHGFHDWQFTCRTVCTVSLSHTQGLVANIERLRNSPVMGDEVPDRYRPAIFHGGERVPFPEPTRPLPKLGRRKVH